MPLPENVQIALSLLQTVGLLIPVVFLALRSYFPDELSRDDRGGSHRTRTVKKAPRPIQIGYIAVGVFVLSGVAAASVVLQTIDDTGLLWLSVVFLMLGFGTLFYVFYLLQDELRLKAV